MFVEGAMQQGHPALGGKPCELLIASALPLAMLSVILPKTASVSICEQYHANPTKAGGLAAGIL